MGGEQVTRSLIHTLSKQIHLFTKWVMLCEVIDFRQPSVSSGPLAEQQALAPPVLGPSRRPPHLRPRVFVRSTAQVD